MRKFLSSTAAATFHFDTPSHTFCVRKDSIEIMQGNDKSGIYQTTVGMSDGSKHRGFAPACRD